ncbi:pyridoxal kinase, putative [Plasmodium vinckei lentum]|uniref:pyridoxal kinase n=1 Tax=Plasmodium vinckei lentum TaxID=138297 RepID=A0A6V7SJS0_PLAVN|nr:pyridoxal kinase, putative [Plasmodium vinckei lentum]
MVNVNKNNIVTIQSQVFDGFCGNNIASFVLRRRGHVPKVLNTVQYYSKYKHYGMDLSLCDMKSILDEFVLDVSNLYGDNNNLHFLTGFIKTKECVEYAIKTILELKNKRLSKCINNNVTINGDITNIATSGIHNEEECLIENIINKNFLWICDPVMGDDGRIYVNKDIVDVYKTYASNADILTPNQYELELLCDKKISNEKDVIDSLSSLLNKGTKIVILTSARYDFDNEHLYAYVSFFNKQNKMICYKYKIKKFDFFVCGTGDLFSSLLLSFIIKQGGSILKIVSQVLNIMQNVIENSIGSMELHIIENQDIIAGDKVYGTLVDAEPVCI